jgi:hypothetical protein
MCLIFCIVIIEIKAARLALAFVVISLNFPVLWRNGDLPPLKELGHTERSALRAPLGQKPKISVFRGNR